MAILLCLSATDKMQAQKASTQSISIFKNGIGFFQKHITVEAKNKIAIIEKLPIAIPNYKRNNSDYIPVMFGSLWFTSYNNPIIGITSFNKEIEKKEISQNIKQILEANINKTATFSIRNYDKPVKAKIIKINKNILILEATGKWITVSPNMVENIEFSDKPNFEFTEKKEQKIFQIDFEKDQNKNKVDLMYMQRGITWSPNYYIELRKGKKASIRFRANLINDIEDIKNAEINFVVGVPSFMFSNTESPLTSKKNMSEFISSLNNTPSYSRPSRPALSNMMVSQSMANYGSDDNYDLNVEISPESGNQEDLYFYNKQGINLKKGGRALIDLLTTKVDYEDIYSVELDSKYDNYNSDNKENQVWHSIRFKNNTKSPFTTGTAFIVKNSDNETKPICQNRLNYTAPNTYSLVKLTMSPDISVTDNEEENSREAKKKKFHGYWYDLVKMKAKIKINNYKKETIKLEIKRLIEGELISCNEKWENKILLKLSDNKNKKNQTSWEIELKKGETKTISYEYHVFVRN